jgi:RNA polymerase sigma-70 factor, ECF subfamily
LDLEGLFRAHQKEVFTYFVRTLGSRDVAEDLAQETFLWACGSALLYRGHASLRTWLFAIARRVLVDHFRRRAPEVLIDPPERQHEEGAQERVDIGGALGRLRVTAREAIILCDVLGFPPQEAAEIVGISANAFRVRLHRARQHFRTLYGHDAS